jgi:adenylate cyclase
MTAPAVVHSTVTGAALFTDIVGFTEFNALRGDQEAVRLLSVQEDCVREELSEGSRIVKELGDGLLLWFPEAHAAIQTAIRLRRRFESISEDVATPLWVRMGLHFGRQTLRGSDIVGHDVNLAARIMDAAGAGEILCSEATRDACRDQLSDVEFEELGPVRMKGIPEPVRLFRIGGGDGW